MVLIMYQKLRGLSSGYAAVRRGAVRGPSPHKAAACSAVRRIERQQPLGCASPGHRSDQPFACLVKAGELDFASLRRLVHRLDECIEARFTIAKRSICGLFDAMPGIAFD